MRLNYFDNPPPWSLRWWAAAAIPAIVLGAMYAALSAVFFGWPIGKAIGGGALFGVGITAFNLWATRRRSG
jgi:hypothetical protein